MIYRAASPALGRVGVSFTNEHGRDALEQLTLGADRVDEQRQDDLPIMLMNPGATTRPWASTVRVALRGPRSPTATIRPPRTATLPVPGIPGPIDDARVPDQQVEMIGAWLARCARQRTKREGDERVDR